MPGREELMKMEKEEIIGILFAVIAELTETVKRQSEEIAKLKAQLNQNSKNSSKPPSSDGIWKPKSLRKPSGKKAGGQKGHEGSGLKLPHEPDRHVRHEPDECLGCPDAAGCRGTKTVHETRYEIDINVSTDITAHQAISAECPRRAGKLTGRFPEGISGTAQYGANMEALAVALNTVGAVSLSRTHEILGGVFGVPISTGTIAAMVSACAEKTAGAVNEIKKTLLRRPAVNVDETGVRVGKKNAWAHVASTDDLTYIDIEEKRGKEGMDLIGFLPGYRGTAVHDCWASYFLYPMIRHGLCNAHLLRELTAVLENAGQAWAEKLAGLLLAVKGAKEDLLSRGMPEAPPGLLEKYRLDYDAILAEALTENPAPEPDAATRKKPKRGKTGALVDRLVLRRDQVLLFFADFSVPFDNNQAERDFRMFKVKQKVSGCFRSSDGAYDYATIMSFVGTARKRGLSAFAAIKNALIGVPFFIEPVVTSD